MNIEPSEAESALAAVRAADAQMRRALNAYGAAYHFIVWGVIWLIGFTISHFATRLPTPVAIWSWPVLDSIGMVCSWTIGIRMSKTFRNPVGSRIGWLWILFIFYGVLGVFFVHPAGSQEATLLLIFFVMLWMSVMGLWLNSALMWAGLAVTGLSLLGYFVLPGYFFLWMAFLGGGMMIGTGIFLLRGGGENGRAR
jgi:hypothetical protein